MCYLEGGSLLCRTRMCRDAAVVNRTCGKYVFLLARHKIQIAEGEGRLLQHTLL